jgi:O-antigen ligase
MENETKNCQNCKQKFTIESEDFNFYEKRIYGTFQSAADLAGDSVSNPNVAGSFLVGCFLMFYSFKKINNKTKKLFLFLLQYLTFFLVLFTLSRSAFIGMIFGIVLINKYLNINLYKFLPISIIFTLIIFILTKNYIHDYQDFIIFDRAISTFDNSTISGSSVTGRIENSSIIFKIALDNILFGIGFGDLENQFNLVPDNFYIHLFAETGIIGILTTIALLIVIFKDIFLMKNIFIKDDFFYHFTSAFLAIYVTFLIENYAANLFRSPRLLGLFWFILALLYKYSSIKSKNYLFENS